jgi:hypothetical protein
MFYGRAARKCKIDHLHAIVRGVVTAVSLGGQWVFSGSRLDKARKSLS